MSASLIISRCVQVTVYDQGDSYSHIRAGTVDQPGIICDNVSDLPAQAGGIAGMYLEMESSAHVISTNEIYTIDSSGSWIRQEQSPFKDVYTKSQIDALLAAMQYEIDSFYVYRYAVSDIINYGIVKNYFTTTQGTQTITDVTFTANGDGTWSTSGTATARRQYAAGFTMPANLPDATYKLTGCPAGGYAGGAVKYCLYIWDRTANIRVSNNDTGDGIEFQWAPDPTHSYNLAIDIRAGTNANDLTFRPMITFKTYDDVTDTFRPHP